MNWYKYWQENYRLGEKNPHKQVGRTLKGKVASNKKWEISIDEIFKIINLNDEDVVLDLCCGNGLLTKEIAPKCKEITSVDYSKKLLDNFVTNEKNIKKINSNALELNFNKDFFDIIIIYFAIQHFSEKEAIMLIGKCKQWLKNDGLLFIGDIPDLTKKWKFYSNKKYRKNYIDSIINDEPIIGTWFDREFFLSIGEYYNFYNTEIIEQKDFMINNKNRFDILFKK